MIEEKIKSFYQSLPVYVMDTAYLIFFPFKKRRKQAVNNM